MYLNTAPSAGYGARYRSVDVTSQVEGASPHRLISILFEELLTSIDTMLAAQRRDNQAKVMDRQSRATMMLLALETSLDYKNGGELAENLAAVYRQSRKLIQIGGRNRDSASVEQARSMISEIASAWAAIA